MSNLERFIYFLIVFACYCLGRIHGENREFVHRAIRSKNQLLALQQNRVGDVRYQLQDDLSVSTFRSYHRLSFGPDLWQKPLSQSAIQINFGELIAHEKDSENPSPTPSPSAETNSFKKKKLEQPLIAPAASSTPTESTATNSESKSDSSEAKKEESTPAPAETTAPPAPVTE